MNLMKCTTVVIKFYYHLKATYSEINDIIDKNAIDISVRGEQKYICDK